MNGSVRRRLIRPRRLAVLGAFIALGVLVVAGFGSGLENQSDPRNDTFGITYGGNPTQDCWKHHKPEGMKDSHYVIGLLPQAIEVGTPRELNIQVANAWKHYISELTIEVSLPGSGPENETHIVPLVGSATESLPPLTRSWKGQLGNPNLQNAPDTGVPSPVPTNVQEVTFEVQPGAVSFYAELWLFFPEGTTDSTVENRVTAKVFPGGKGTGVEMRTAGTSDRSDTSRHRELALPLKSGIDVITPQPGTWRAQFAFEAGDAPLVEYAFNVTAVYAAAGSNTFQVFNAPRDPPGETDDPAKIVDVGGVTDVISIPVIGVSPGVQVVDIMVEAQIYYKHQSGGTPDQDWFRRYYTAQVVVGDEYIPTAAQASTGGAVEADFYLVAGEISGFAAAFLLVPSLLFGGTYGRGSRKLFNAMLGGAKRRVMFHSLMSLGLTLTAIVHIVLFLLEVRYTVLMGILWGGLGALGLLVLGLTGYYQVPFIQRFGYNAWRWLHLGFGLVVMVFVAYHAVADGPDFFFIKEQLPQWVNDLNFAQK